MHDQLYKSPVRLKEHTDDSGSFFGALGFTSPVEQLALRTAPAESLLTWLTQPTGPHLVEAVLTSESHTALAIVVTPEALYDPYSPRVGLDLVYKAPYIKTASFSEAFFYLKSASEAEADKRITHSHLMFVQINEASKVIPLPYVQPLFLDVPTTSDITDSNKPKSPHAFRAFRLHRVIYMEGSTLTTQVAFPHLGGKTKSHLLNFQKQLLIPELREQPLLSVALAVADDEHWNITDDPIYPACLAEFRKRHEASQASQANKSVKKSGTGGGSPTLAMTPPSATSSKPPPTPALGDREVMELVHDTLDQVYALHLETLQEMGFIREVDRALAKSIVSEFIRLQLIVGDDLNTSLQAMHADLEATTDELIRHLDIAVQNSTDLPSENPSVRVALHRFRELVKLKLTLPLAQVDAAREDMDRFLQHHLEELHSPTDMRNLIESLSQRVAAHQSRVHQIVYSEPLKHAEVTQRVLMGMAADQPVESNFFPGILEGLLGRLGIAAPGEKNPPTSSKEGAAGLWASAVLDAVQKTEKRRVRLETSGSSGMPPGLHLNYEEDFLNCRSHQVPGVFTDPFFLPNIVNSVYKLVRPPVLAEAPPFTAANDHPTTPVESVDDRNGTVTPSPSPSTASTPTEEKGRVGLPATHVQIIGDSGAESDKTEDLEPEEDSSYSAQVFPSKSDRTLRKQTCSKSDGSKDSKDGAPPPKRVTVKNEKEVDDYESSSSTGLSDETLRDHRFTVYGKDSTAVHEVRAKILSLKAGMRPSQQDINSSPIFALRRAADESQPLSIIGKHWVPHLKQKGHLADCKPKDFTYKDGWLPLYTRAGITKHLSGLESLLNKDKTSPLIAVILPEMDFQYEREYVIHKLHKSESLNRISISYNTNQRKQMPSAPTMG